MVYYSAGYSTRSFYNVYVAVYWRANDFNRGILFCVWVICFIIRWLVDSVDNAALHNCIFNNVAIVVWRLYCDKYRLINLKSAVKDCK